MIKKDALIGFSGFVGSILLKQKYFDHLYRSTNIHEIDNQEFDTVVCAGAPAQKWIANSNPGDDKERVESLINHIRTIKCKTFVLISTVDVFQEPVNVDESTLIRKDGLHPYGLHRLMLEHFVEQNFTNQLIVRLPGLIGPGLRKNVIYDLLNDNNVDIIDSRGVFQFYPMVNLWYDIETALKNKINLVHLAAQPISVEKISEKGFGRPFFQEINNAPARYDMQSLYSDLFGGQGKYQYNMRETIQAIRAYAQSEPGQNKSNIMGGK